MKEKFTPGDWKLDGFEVYKPSDSNNWLHNRFTLATVTVFNEGRANAHLIAAAPKMYRLLQKFIPCDEDGNGAFLYSDGSEFMGEEVTKLLAEARGENNDHSD